MDDGLVIHGGEKLSGTRLDPHDDHRLAMSLAVVGLKIPEITINNEECVNSVVSMFLGIVG